MIEEDWLFLGFMVIAVACFAILAYADFFGEDGE